MVRFFPLLVSLITFFQISLLGHWQSRFPSSWPVSPYSFFPVFPECLGLLSPFLLSTVEQGHGNRRCFFPPTLPVPTPRLRSLGPNMATRTGFVMGLIFPGWAYCFFPFFFLPTPPNLLVPSRTFFCLRQARFRREAAERPFFFLP